MRYVALSATALFVLAVAAPPPLAMVSQDVLFPLELFPVGSGATQIRVGNLNGDSHLDIAAVVGATDSVEILLASDDGGFLPSSSLLVGDNPAGLALGDLDLDGVLDLITANQDSQDVSVRLGVGDGTFTTGPTLLVPDGKKPATLVLGDFNGDGHTDVAVGTNAYITDSIWAWLGVGDGTFLPPTSSAGGAPVTALAAGDVNGDGFDDLAAAHVDAANPFGEKGVDVLLSNSDGSFWAAGKVGGNAKRLDAALADIDLNGTLDLVTVDGSGDRLSCFVGNGDGTFSAPIKHAVGAQPGDVQVADLDGDGWPDVLAACAGQGEVAVLLGAGDGTLTPATLFACPPQTIGLAVGEWSGDGSPDVATLNVGSMPTISTLINKGDGAMHTARFFAAPLYSSHLLAGPLVPGGGADVAIAWEGPTYDSDELPHPLGTNVYAGAGDGSFALSDALDLHAHDLLLAELNGDGLNDLVGFDGSTVNVSYSQAPGSYGPSVSYATGGNLPRGMAAGDLDGDGDIDFAVANSYGFYQEIDLLFNQGNASFGSGVVLQTPGNPWYVTLADLDTDGDLDIVCAHYTSVASLSLYFNRGGGLFGPEVPLDAGSWPSRPVILDLDGDGALDIAVANRFDDVVTILIGHGDGTFETGVTYPAGTKPVDLHAAYIDTDRSIDFMVTNFDPGPATNKGNVVSVLKGLGDGTLASPRSFHVPYPVRELDLADINGDLRPDVVLLGFVGTYLEVGIVLLNQTGPWNDLGYGLASPNQTPRLTGQGSLTPSDDAGLLVTQAAANSALVVVAGTSAALLPFKGGVLVPQPDLLFSGTTTDGSGMLLLQARWPSGLPAGFELHAQAWLPDASGPQGFAATNAIVGTAP